MGDESYGLALKIARTMGKPPEPEWLKDPAECVRIVELV
jgi:hypothetical protein